MYANMLAATVFFIIYGDLRGQLPRKADVAGAAGPGRLVGR